MPDQRQHRGRHPQDEKLFGPQWMAQLNAAVEDYSWLLEREYATKSALELVGNRYQLHERQRLAVMRSACTPQARQRREAHQVNVDMLRGRGLWIDGYNALITVEAALAGGLILQGRDGCYRDLASLHGTFRQVEETTPALMLIGKALEELGVAQSTWYFDSPVSNSGRLKLVLQEMSGERQWNWRVEVVINPDPVLAGAEEIIATADSVILDQCRHWFNLGRWIVERYLPSAWLVDLSGTR